MSTLDATGQPENDLPADLPPLPADRAWPHPWMSPFLRSLSLIPDVSSACRVARVARSRVYQVRDELPEFKEAWAEALQLANDYLNRHLHTWITTGVPVRSVRTVTKRKLAPDGTVLESHEETITSESAERSATLAIFWAKAWQPERYRWKEGVELTGAEGGPVQFETVAEIDAKIAALAAEIAARAGDQPVPTE